MIATRSRTRARPALLAARRRGFGLIEMAISTLMLAAAMVATIQVIGWVALEARSAGRRERAVREVANLMERVSARPYDAMTDEALADLKLSGEMAALPGSALAVRVARVDAAPAGKRITVEVRWDDRSGRPEAPARLVGYFHQAGGPGR